MPMATKLGKKLTYNKELPPTKSKETLIMWLCQITRQTKNFISPLTQ